MISKAIGVCMVLFVAVGCDSLTGPEGPQGPQGQKGVSGNQGSPGENGQDANVSVFIGSVTDQSYIDQDGNHVCLLRAEGLSDSAMVEVLFRSGPAGLWADVQFYRSVENLSYDQLCDPLYGPASVFIIDETEYLNGMEYKITFIEPSN